MPWELKNGAQDLRQTAWDRAEADTSGGTWPGRGGILGTRKLWLGVGKANSLAIWKLRQGVVEDGQQGTRHGVCKDVQRRFRPLRLWETEQLRLWGVGQLRLWEAGQTGSGVGAMATTASSGDSMGGVLGLAIVNNTNL